MSSRKARNNVRSLREQLLMSKAELARRAGISALTIHRIEGGHECRVETKRKIILALGKTLEQREEVFPVLARGTHRAERTGTGMTTSLHAVRKSGRSKGK